MIRKLLHKFARNTAKNALEKYLNTLENLSDEELAIALGCAAVGYSQMIDDFGSGICFVMTTSSESELSALSKSDNAKLLSNIILHNHRMIIDLYDKGHIGDSAGFELLIMTFRCMLYPELYPIGIEIWDTNQINKLLAKNILIKKREEFEEKGKSMGMEGNEIEEKLKNLDFAIEIIETLRPTVFN